MTQKIKTDFFIDCSCGAKSAVFENKDGKWYTHCVNCGRLTFWSNPMLTERLKFGGKLCPHNIEVRNCRSGRTSFCKICRVRVFAPGGI